MKPLHDNQCGHPTQTFHTTLTLGGKEGDLYFFHDATCGGWRYCFRHGKDGDYTTAGIDNLLRPTCIVSDRLTAQDVQSMMEEDKRIVLEFLKFRGEMK